MRSDNAPPASWDPGPPAWFFETGPYQAGNQLSDRAGGFHVREDQPGNRSDRDRDGYLNETFFGRPVEFFDDSILTMYALERGKAVQQPTAFAFTAMPENMSHHVRQYVRWMRRAMIRSFWRFKYLRVSGYAFWAHIVGWVQWVIATSLFLVLFVVQPVLSLQYDWALYLIPLLIAYGQGLRYFTVRRSDQSRWSQFLTYMLTRSPQCGCLWGSG